MAVSEYDAFGPWIYEITDAHPVPRLFANDLPSETAAMLFKIPRSIERRVATPDLDLYDYVVGAYANDLCILKREDHNVVTSRIPYTEIEGLCLTRHFLHGVLTLYLKTGTAELPFNAVSMDIITRFAALIRGQISGGALPPAAVPRQEALSLNLLFINMLNDLRAAGETPLLYAYQPSADSPQPQKAGLRGIFRHVHPKKRPATLHVLIPKEVIVIQQDPPTGKQQKEELIYHTFYLPLSGLHDLTLTGGPQEQLCSLSLADHTFTWAIQAENISLPPFCQYVRTLIAPPHRT